MLSLSNRFDEIWDLKSSKNIWNNFSQFFAIFSFLLLQFRIYGPKNWIEIRKQLNIGASLGEIASHCLFQGRQDNQLRFLIDSDETSLYDTAHQQSLAVALSEYFDEQLSVEIIFGVAEQETPRAADIREKSERLAIAVETLNSDPSVVKFKQLFDGELDEKSVRPID